MRLMVLLMLLTTSGMASEAQDQEARALFERGQAAYSAQNYQQAYDLFRRSYLLSQAPPLLYNMASALQALGQPHQAAEELRAFLRARPDETDRPAIEERIRALEEAQRILDGSRPSPQPLVVAPPPAPPPRRKHTVAIVLSIVGVVVVASALAVGLGIGLSPQPSDATLGVHQGTP